MRGEESNNNWGNSQQQSCRRIRVRHMLKLPSRADTTTANNNNNNNNDNSVSAAACGNNSFCKDGRKISVGDCALFKPPQDSPPFIGLIRSLSAGRENKLRLGVNWLYRPAEVKLSKGSALEAAPNELFYSFHTDDILAASLLHPCRVAFLPRGVELPSGVSSFVCRRVYDITNKCLWWLTDQDFINERQQEVDQLLQKTRIEMHATVQPGGRSPRPINSPTSSQLKAGSDSVQSSGSSFGSQSKGKKRERGEQGSEPVKRERTAKTEDTESGHYRHESSLKSELTKFTDKGGLVDSEGVEKLVQLMVPDRTGKKLNLACRSLLAGVIASTEKFDCLSQFVQLRGLQVFDEWLQEVHKSKIGESNGAKDADRLVEEFLLVLLRALDKLPVNLQALQKCNIGKSANHLRSHKNMEIQKKSRSLVDRWKKRVEAEMNINDAKSGPNQGVSWPARPRLSETSHGGSRHYSGSSEVAVKSLATQVPSSKTTPATSVQAEAATTSASVSPGSGKSSLSPASATTNLNGGQSCPSDAGVSSDPPSVTRNDKSSIPSQSYNNSQSFSGDQARLAGSASKEDAKSSTAGSFPASKASGSRHRKSAMGFSGLSGIRKKSGSGRSSLLHRASDSDKVSHAGLTGEKIVESPVEGNSHKLIVKIPNRGRSPARGSIGGPLDGPSAVNSQASSPVLPEKHDRHGHNSKEKSGTCRANDSSDAKKDYCRGNDYKDKRGGFDVGRLSPSSSPDEKRNRTSSEGRKLVDVSKDASQFSGNEHESNKLHEDSLSSINVLIESCVKYSESNISMSVADDIGMNLLASVAAGEMSKSELVSPTGSSERNSSPTEKSCTFNDSKAKSKGVGSASEQFRSSDGVSNEHVKLEEHDGYTSSGMYMQQFAEHCIEGDVKSNLLGAAGDSVSMSAGTLDRAAESGGRQSKEKKVFNDANADCNADCKKEAVDCVLNEKKATDVAAGVAVEMVDPEGISGPSLEIQNNKNIIPVSSSTLQRVQKPPPSGVAKVKSEDALMSSASGKDIGPDSVVEVRADNADERDTSGDFDQAEKKKIEVETNATIKTEIQVGAASVGTASTNQESDCVLGKVSNTDGLEKQCSRPGPDGLFSAVATQEVEESVRSKCLKLNDTDADYADECTSTAPDASAPLPLTDTKATFDLNEGLNADDGRCMEQTNVTAAVCSTTVPILSPVDFPASPVSLGLPASITVAAPAKGPFVPPEDLLRNRGELGWKGSAATSAFRPAEPRRVLEVSSVTNSSTVGQEVSSKKTSRPPLDIDLNVPDDRILDDIALCSKPQEMGSASVSTKCYNGALLRGSGGLGLDLNELVEANDMGECAESNNLRLLDAQFLPGKASPVSLSNGEINSYRDFDLNDGPATEEAPAEPVQLSQHTRSNLPAHAPVSCFRMNNTNMGNLSSWFPRGNSYSAITVPSALPDRGEQALPVVASGGPPRMIATATGGALFNTDMYRGPVLSSSPAAPFGSSPFQYPVFPFGTSFPMPSATFSGGSSTYVDSSTGGRLCFSPVPSQLLGPTAAVSPFPRPYVFSLTDGSSNSGAECNRNLGRQGLDLNAGPGGHDIEGRYESSSPFSSRQQSLPSSQAVGEEQARIYHVPGATPKRKVPEGGWNGYRQFSWQ